MRAVRVGLDPREQRFHGARRTGAAGEGPAPEARPEAGATRRRVAVAKNSQFSRRGLLAVQPGRQKIPVVLMPAKKMP